MKRQFIAAMAIAIIGFSACKNKDNNTVTPSSSEYTELSGDISGNMTLDASKKYMLKGFVYVTNGATLTIPAGTHIMGDKASKGTLIITRGSKIDAEGTASNPVIFTSAQAAGARRDGDWGGIIILGKAPINPTGSNAKIEGGLTATNGGDDQKYIYYGGTDANDNSGTIRYARIEFAGIAFSPDNEINGLTLGGVGAGTTISYVQVYRSGDDAFEWFGGTVNCDHLIATYSWDDDWDTDFGYSGHVQFGVSQRSKTIADQSGSNGFESDNDGNGSLLLPQTRAMFSNMTVIGPITGANPSTSPVAGINANFQNGAQIRRNSAESIYNSIITGFPVGLYIDDSKGTATSTNADGGSLNFKNNIIAGCVTKFKSAASWTNSAAWYAATNTTELDSAQFAGLMDPNKFSTTISTTSAGRPDYRLKSGSPALTGASFTGTTGFQTNVPYRGAFDGTTDWTSGWATYDAENTNY